MRRDTPLPYTAQYDAATHTVQAALPDGAYTFLASLQTNDIHVLSFSKRRSHQLATAILAVSQGRSQLCGRGPRALGLQIPMSELGSNPIQVIMTRDPNGSAQTGDPRIYVTLSQTGGGSAMGWSAVLRRVLVSRRCKRNTRPQVRTGCIPPSARRRCARASFTAGGASLAREPLVLTIAGTTAPLVLSLRDDCAELTLSLPGSVGLSAGEEPFYTVYVVPDFDSTEDVVPQTLRPSTGGSVKLTGLTPGNYHVYTFDRPVALAYRDPAVLASLPGQAVTLAPGADVELTVEVPQR